MFFSESKFKFKDTQWNTGKDASENSGNASARAIG